LVELCKENVIELYRRPTRGSGRHYRVIDNDPKMTYSEDEHEPLTPLSTRTGSVEADASLAPDFESALQDPTKVRRSNDPEKDFLLLTAPEIFAVKSLASERYPTLGYNDLTFGQLKVLYTEVRDEWNNWLQKPPKCKRSPVAPSRR